MFSTSTNDLISLAYGAGGIWTAVLLARRWRSFWSAPLDAAGRQLAVQVAFFLVIPIGVLLHEVGHALATWSVGGHVVELSWRVYWGFVVPEGRFSAAADWWIALSGNLVSIAIGLALLAAGHRGTRLRPPVRYVLIQAGLLELIFAAVAYPLLSFGGTEGDWKVIYDFHATPVLSALSALAHAGLLGALLAWRRTGRPQEEAWAVGHGLESELARRRAAADARPAIVDAHLDLGRFLLDHGQPKLAEGALRRALRACGERADLHGALGTVVLAQGRPAEATIPLQRAADLGTGDQRVLANLGIALAASGHGPEALDAFARVGEPLASDPLVAEWRRRAATGDTARPARDRPA